jgi:hypothetical protein
VCEGSPAPLMNNCVQSRTIVAWGADPVLTATRLTPTTVRLSVAVDNMSSLASISVTRQESDDPCRQGTTLGNGEQGCRTQVIPGVTGNGATAPINVTVYEHSGGFGSNSSAAPWVIDVPDDTVKAGVEYYYIAHVTWMGPSSQDSGVVTVPTKVFLKAPIGVKGMAAGNKMMIHPAPSPNSGSRAQAAASSPAQAPVSSHAQATVASRAQTVLSPATTLDSAVAAVQQKPGDAQSLYSLGQAYCASRSKNTCVSLMYMGLLQANAAGNTNLAERIRQSLEDQGVVLAGVH